MTKYFSDSINMIEYVDIIRQNNITPNIIMDLGSMDGGDAIFLKNTFPTATVYAIEGFPENYERFKDNTQIVAVNTVVCSHDGVIPYHIKKTNGIHSIYDRGQIYGNTILHLPCCTFKTLMNNYNIKHIDVLKLDVEGATFDVLWSLQDYINKITIMHIETETVEFFKDQKLQPQVFEFLQDHKFKKVAQKSADITRGIDDNVIELLGSQTDSIWIKQ